MSGFPCLASLNKFSYDIVSFLPEDANLYLATPGLKSFAKSVSACPRPIHPSAFPSPRRLSHVRTEGAEHTANRCWIGCYFSRPTRPNPAQDGVRGHWGQDMQVWGRGSEFPVFYPFATWSPIERNKTLRANRRVARLGPPARPQESCPLRGGEEESSRNQWRKREGGRGSCQQTWLHHMTRQRHRNTPTHTAAQQGVGKG